MSDNPDLLTKPATDLTLEQPKTLRPHISFSELMMFRNDCQNRWKLDYLDGRRSSIFGVHLDFGTAVHSAVELYLTRADKNPVSLEEAISIFENKFNELHSLNSSKYKEKEQKISKDAMIISGKRIISAIKDCPELSGGNVSVVYNEYPLFDDIDRSDDVKIKFKGFIDLVIKTTSKKGDTILIVCDFKTCQWGWTGDKIRDENMQAQLLFYKHFLCKKFNLDPKFVRTAFVLLKKNPRKNSPVIDFIPISAGPIVVNRAIDNLNKDITRIKLAVLNDSFEKNKSNCVNAYGDTCPYFKTDLCKG